jgi:hypothetical protein
VDKDDLLTGRHGIFAENLGEQMLAHAGESASAFSSRTWFYHIQAQGDILKVLAKDSAMELAMKTLRGIIHNSIQEGMQAHKDASMPLSLLVDYLTDTLMTLIKWWFKDGMKYTPEQMDEMFQQLVMPGIVAALKGTNGG